MLKRASIVFFVLTAILGPVLSLASEEGLPNLPLRYERLNRWKDTWITERWGFQGKVTVGPNDKAEQPFAPQGEEHVMPRYTPEARKKRISGVVQVQLWIDTQGKVVDAAVTQKLEPSLDRNTFEILRRWRCKPASLNGAPMPSVMIVNVTFQVQ